VTRQVQYSDAAADGPLRRWHENGQQRSEENRIQGELDGLQCMSRCIQSAAARICYVLMNKMAEALYGDEYVRR
jgi:hypothetical protein